MDSHMSSVWHVKVGGKSTKQQQGKRGGRKEQGEEEDGKQVVRIHALHVTNHGLVCLLPKVNCFYPLAFFVTPVALSTEFLLFNPNHFPQSVFLRTRLCIEIWQLLVGRVWMKRPVLEVRRHCVCV